MSFLLTLPIFISKQKSAKDRLHFLVFANFNLISSSCFVRENSTTSQKVLLLFREAVFHSRCRYIIVIPAP